MKIQKLTIQKLTIAGKKYEYPDTTALVGKINELVDAVNKLETMAKNTNTVLESLVEENNIHEKQIDELQMKLEPEKCEIPADNSEKANCQENMQDKFAEQRKWIGKLCKFWDIDNNNLYYGPLTKIHDTSPYCYECNHKMCYAFCEPVSEDLIYKGGDND